MITQGGDLPYVSYLRVEGVIFWDWVDAEMCSRSTQVIPGLRRRINKLEVDARSAKNTMKELKTDNCKLLLESNTTKRRIRQMLMVVIGWIIWVVMRAASSPSNK